MKKSAVLLLLGIISSMLVYSKDPESKRIKVLYRQKIELKDGINLSANVYLPTEMSDPLPAIMVFTPYNNDHNTFRGEYYARRSYVFVSVDVRGRGDSEGRIEHFENEGKDGYEAVEWIAAQPWCNGKVGLMGGSYKGMVQWLIAKEQPPHLVSMAPTATVAPGIDATRTRNIYRYSVLSNLTFVSGNVANRNNMTSRHLKENLDYIYRNHLGYNKVKEVVASPPENDIQKVFETWISHPTLDEYWKGILPSKEDFEKIDIPILSITGYFDSDQPGHMYYVDNFMKYASEEAQSKLYFINGPWSHGGTRRPASELGGLNFGNEAVIDILKLHKEWFDWTMKDGEKPEFLKKHVAYFNIGENKWKYTDNLKSLSDKEIKLFLSSPEGNPEDVYSSGSLEDSPINNKETDILVYDPLDNSSKGDLAGPDYLLDQSYKNEDGWLFYHSSPIVENTELSGFITLNAWLEIDTKDTDLYFKLSELQEDGKAIYLGHGIMRARYRESLEKEVLINPGEINLYSIKSLHMINKTIKKGSRLRLAFGYLNSSEYQKNYNSGKDVSYETASDAQTCTIKLYMNKKYQSSLVLPVKEQGVKLVYPADWDSTMPTISIPKADNIERAIPGIMPSKAALQNTEYIHLTKRHKVSGSSYVILTDYNSEEALKQLEKLAKYRKGTVVTTTDMAKLYKDSNESQRLKDKLKELDAKYVALAPEAESYTENMLLGVLEILCTLDNDRQVDVYPGILYAEDEKSLTSLVNKTINYRPQSIEELSPMSECMVPNTKELRSLQKSGIIHNFFAEFGKDTPMLNIYNARAQGAPEISGNSYRIDMEPKIFIKELPANQLAQLQNSSLLVMHGHGLPGVSCGIDIDALPEKLNTEIILCGSCFSASVKNSDIDQMRLSPDGYPVIPRKSFALQAIDLGALVVFGHMRTNEGFPVLFPVLEAFTRGSTVGEAYQELLNNSIERGEFYNKELAVREKPENPRRLKQNILLYVLLGDPALQPFENFEKTAQVEQDNI